MNDLVEATKGFLQSVMSLPHERHPGQSTSKVRRRKKEGGEMVVELSSTPLEVLNKGCLNLFDGRIPLFVTKLNHQLDHVYWCCSQDDGLQHDCP